MFNHFRNNTTWKKTWKWEKKAEEYLNNLSQELAQKKSEYKRKFEDEQWIYTFAKQGKNDKCSDMLYY